MHYFKFHIGDFIRATNHLTDAEELAYRRLLDLYYESEQPLPLETQWVARRIRAVSEVVEFVLSEFFERTSEGWRNKRADLEIREYYAIVERNRVNGKSGGRPKKTQSVTTRIPTETPTINHKPETINQEKKKQSVNMPDGVAVEVWSDFLLLRNKLRAPVTNTVISGIAREAAKAGIQLGDALRMCCERGWRGFKAEWLANKTPMQSAHQASTLAAARSIFGDERSLTNERIIDITPRKALT